MNYVKMVFYTVKMKNSGHKTYNLSAGKINYITTFQKTTIINL